MGTVLKMGDYSRTSVKARRDQANFDGFCRALVYLRTLNRCGSVVETQLSLQNLMNADLLTQEERDAFYKYFGWELSK